MSLSLDGGILAVGGPGDNGGIGATWIYVSDGFTYQPLSPKLVGSGSSGLIYSRAGIIIHVTIYII